MNQQSSASRVAGKNFRTFVYQGVPYLLSQPLRLGSYVEQEAIVLWKRLDPSEFGTRLIATLPSSYHAAIWQGCAAAAMRGIPTSEEWEAYAGSQWKTAYDLWNCIDPKHKVDQTTKQPISLIDGVQWASDVLSNLPTAERNELLVKINIVSQADEIKNSSGRIAPATPAENQPPETQATTDGQP